MTHADPNHTPLYITIEQARRELGGCSRSYVYGLMDKDIIKSTNPLGGRRLIELDSVRALVRERVKRPAVAQKKSRRAAR